MKQTGINYFYNQIAGTTDAMQVFYTFDDNAGSIIHNNTSGISGYSGILSSVGNFWSIPNTGNCTGQNIRITDASGLFSNNWTKTFVTKKVNTKDVILFSNLTGQSGYSIGLNNANKLYFQTINDNIPYIYTSQNTISSQNVLTVSKVNNNIQFGYYDLTKQKIEYESFGFNYSVARSDNWILAPSYTGYLDYFIYFNQNIGFNALQSIYSGFFYTPTGVSDIVQFITTTGITGYQSGLLTQTGITGFVSIASGGGGTGFYTGLFPNSGVSVPLTGILSQTFFSSGLSGSSTSGVIVGQTVTYLYNSGYAQLFGMEKIVNFFPLTGTDIIDYSNNRTPSLPNFNLTAGFLTSGYLLNSLYNTVKLNPYLNGLYNDTGDFTVKTGIMYISGGSLYDVMTFDIVTGTKNTFNYLGNGTTPITYSGQEIYLNGLELISGKDFIASGTTIRLIGDNTGITGKLDENGLILNHITGNFTFYTGIPFSRYSSRYFINGLKQQINSDYFEGAIVDLLSGNTYNYFNNINVYDNNGNFWF